MNSTLQDIMGLLNRYKTKTPTDADYMVIAGHTSRGVLVPQPTLEPNVITVGALKDYILKDVGSTPTLQQVLDNNHDLVDNNFFAGTDAGNDNSGSSINAIGGNSALRNSGNLVNALGDNSAIDNTGDNVNAFGYQSGYDQFTDSNNVFNNVNLFGAFANANEDGQTVLSKDGTIMARISTTELTDSRKYTLQDASGTLAFLSDISSFVPYTGATSSLDMGNNSIFVGVSGSPNNITLETQSDNGVISNSPGSKLMLSPDSLKLTDNQFGGSLKLNLRPTGLTTGNNFLIEFPAESGKIPLIKYKVYTALLTQTGTSAPVATVLENTLSTLPTWGRDADGQYRISNISFDPAKTFYVVSGNPTGNPNFRIGLGFDGFNNRITVSTLNFYSSAGTDGVLNNTSIEIRVYN